jgi:hypothetical protein
VATKAAAITEKSIPTKQHWFEGEDEVQDVLPDPVSGQDTGYCLRHADKSQSLEEQTVKAPTSEVEQLPALLYAQQ